MRNFSELPTPSADCLKSPTKVSSFRLAEQTVAKPVFKTSVMSDAFNMKESIKA